MTKTINEPEEKICIYCHKDPGPRKRNPGLWNGFLDKETNQLVCMHCRKKHYGIKSNKGAQPFSMVEYPVQICSKIPS